jgi:hypothetical protein
MPHLNLKCLLLGTASIMAATSAQGADLPVAPEPVDYVRICDAYGSKFYYIPGTETCLRVGGRVRTQVTLNNMADEEDGWGDRADNGYDFRTQGYLYLDARTATEFGILRAYTELSGYATGGSSETFDLGSTYIQWGGLTMGYLSSNFDFYTGSVWSGPAVRTWSDTTLQQIAYTATFGNGISFTAAIENGESREVTNSAIATSYGGTRIPDFVAALNISQGWGQAQLMGALHHVRPAAVGTDEHLGFAVGGGVIVNLPMAPGSNINFQAAYADGALSYLGAGYSATINGTNVSAFDYFGNDTSTGYSIGGGIYYQATSTIGLALDGSYLDLDLANTANDATAVGVDASVQWEPVSGFVLGGDVGYNNLDIDNVGDFDQIVARFRVQRTF